MAKKEEQSVFAAVMRVAQIRKDAVRLVVDKRTIKGLAPWEESLTFPVGLVGDEELGATFKIIVTKD